MKGSKIEDQDKIKIGNWLIHGGMECIKNI